MKNRNRVWLYLFPALYLLLGFYFRQVFGDLSLRTIDPEYIHFISGLCVSTGKFSQANTDQPAALLQILLAVVFKAVYFFREHNLPYFEDVIRHSDLYLAVGNLTITAILSTAMLWTGKTVHKLTRNPAYALAIQASPFLLNIWYDLSGRIYAELLFLIPVFMIQVLLLRELYDQNLSDRKRIGLYALAVSVGLSLKMTFLPFFILPLFFIRRIRNKLKYGLLTALFFFLFSPQVLFQFGRFRRWMFSIFIHNGTYESGAKSIINKQLFIKNLETLFAVKHYFFEAFILLIVLTLALILTKRAKSVQARTGMALTLVLLGFIFFMGKHYEMRYFVPALLFFPFLLVTNIETLRRLLPQKTVYATLSILLILVIGYRLKQEVGYMRVVSQSVGQQVGAREKTRAVIRTLTPKSYKIIVSQDYGCPVQAYAIMYSFAMGGKQWPHYREKLDKLYPDVYQYFTWDNSVRFWGKPFIPDSVIHSGKPVYLYLEKNTPTLYRKTIRKLFGDSARYEIQNKLLFENPYNHEAVIQLFATTRQDKASISGPTDKNRQKKIKPSG
jgi:hypothetical protein